MKQNIYNDISIYETTYADGNQIRIYEIDGGWHSATYIKKELRNELIFEYMKIASRVFSIQNIQSMCMIGGGTYSFAKYAISHYPNLLLDVCEIDEMSIQVAKDYFYLDELQDDNRLTVFIEDGRDYLENCHTTYDCIFNDAFVGIDPVLKLLTKEFVEVIHLRLNKNGIYVANLPGLVDIKKSKLLLNAIKTLQTAFQYVYLISARSEYSGNRNSNYVVFASDMALSFPDALSFDIQKANVLLDSSI